MAEDTHLVAGPCYLGQAVRLEAAGTVASEGDTSSLKLEGLVWTRRSPRDRPSAWAGLVEAIG